MIEIAPYMARLYHHPGTWVRAFVNDLPMYDRPVESAVATDFPATPWFIPGENELVLEIAEAPKPESFGNAAPSFELTFFGEAPPQLPAGRPRLVPLLETKFPKLLAELPPEDWKLPVRWSAKFTPTGNIPPPIWEANQPEKIPELGSPALLRALFGLHQAFARKDVDAMADALDLKLEDQSRYHPGSPRLVRAEVKKEHAEMLEGDWKVDPFEPEKIRFRSCAQGRVAYAHREDGGPALSARNGPHAWKVRPLFVRQGADWKIYR